MRSLVLASSLLAWTLAVAAPTVAQDMGSDAGAALDAGLVPDDGGPTSDAGLEGAESDAATPTEPPTPTERAAEVSAEVIAENESAPPPEAPLHEVRLRVDEFGLTPLPLPQIEWRPEWGRFSMAEYIVTASAFSATLAAAIIGPSGSSKLAPFGFDESARGALRADTEIVRRAARDASDLLLGLTSSYWFLVDALIVTAWLRESPDAAIQMSLVGFETIAVVMAVQGIVSNFTGRERPYGRECGNELDDRVDDCDGNNRFQSFFSGHTAQSFASAAVTCSHHANLPLYGGGAAEAVPCISAFAFAGTTALLRVVGDQHYLSDVLTGAFIGTSLGLALPYLLHYSGSAPETGPSVHLVPMPMGAAAVGTF